MKIIQSSTDIKLNFITNYPIEKICFMDIETTGLSKKHHQIYLIGFLIYDYKTKLWQLTQFFCDSSSDEELILKEFMKELKKYKYLITYNGDNFDIPFLNEKLKKYSIKEIEIESIDLYQVLRKNKNFISFPNLKLKTIEKELGIDRRDTFTGFECIEFYKNYLITKSTNFFNYIIQHNQDDLYSMPKLLRVFQLIEENKSIKIKIDSTSIFLKLKEIGQSGDLIIITGTWMDTLKFSSHYYNNFYSIAINKNSDFKLKIEVNKGKLEEKIIAYYIDTIRLGLSSKIKDLSGYNPPDNILILKVNKNIILKNIKNLIKEIVLSLNYINPKFPVFL